MAKVKSIYFCKECGGEHAKWQGKCNFCGSWNTLSEHKVQNTKSKASSASQILSQNTAQKLEEIPNADLERISVEDEEFARVMGGGVVPGSLILIGGEPGIGKSTLLLQLALSLKKKVLYVSGEESLGQIKIRAERLGLSYNNAYFLDSHDSQHVLEQCKLLNAEILIIDSIQTMASQEIDGIQGSIGQIRQCTTEFQQLAKSNDIPVFLIGHINKEGNLAGPKILEHMVDVVLQFEGDAQNQYRLLRTIKNRFGSTSELGIYDMKMQGLSPVYNPSQAFLEHRCENDSGIAVAIGLEGIRPIMIETQALVSPAVYGNPQRSSNGFDLRRLNMHLAVLEKRCGLKLGNKDVYLNITGGIKLKDPAIDLATICAIISSYMDQVIPSKSCFAAEVGLSGEIRPIAQIDLRIKEAEKMGFERLFISSAQQFSKGLSHQLKLIPCARLQDVTPKLFKL